MVEQKKPIAESNNFIILDRYDKQTRTTSYQSESDLERAFIQDLVSQGYEFLRDLTTPKAMLDNLRHQLETLNDVQFSSDEWARFVAEWLDKPSEGISEKGKKIHEAPQHDFTFDDRRTKNIYLVDKSNITRNKLQVIRQFEQTGSQLNRYDVTILVNGLPLVQVELKKRGVAIREAFNQIHRYSKESFNSENSLYKYLQIFVISNGTDSRYFANTTTRDKNSFDFTINWARSDNELIKDLKDFTATFFQKNTLLKVLLHYAVFDQSETLLIMRPYQIAATERILWKINSSHQAKNFSTPESGGYIWHTTGSGKTLTSFKVARMAGELDFIDKVLFVVDRKDLDHQTMAEYKKFDEDSVNGSINTAALKRNLEQDDNKIVVTTIQKLNNLMKSEANLPVYDRCVVFIFDECHRSQFGEAQKNLKKKFKRYYQFGFTGTPIFQDNALDKATTTESVFGASLHSYVITDAIRDEKVLKFKVDYNDVRPKFREIEGKQDTEDLKKAENKHALLHPSRIEEISQYILDNYRYKTHRLQGGNKGFNAMFAVSSVEAAKMYYQTLNKLQENREKKLKIATIFSFAANEDQDAIGEISDESFDVSAMDKTAEGRTAKEFLQDAVEDYNRMFKESYSIDSQGFQNYYTNLAKRVKQREIDLLIVVGMFLTGFDAPQLNTLFVDKNLRYHGLIQTYSRTNRIYDATKTFGNIVTFRNLEAATIEAIKLFGTDEKSTMDVVLEKSYKDYMDGFTDPTTGATRRGFKEVVSELKQRFPNPENIAKEGDKKEFVKLFGDYLRLENVLQNYDEFAHLTAFQNIDKEDAAAVKAFGEEHHLNADDFAALRAVKMPVERDIQDYRSTYNDIRDWLRREKEANKNEEFTHDWDDVVFEVELLKSQEINLDYILEQIFEHSKKTQDKAALVENISRMIRASMDHRAKEGLLVDFINQTDLDALGAKESVIEAFYGFAKKAQQREAAELIKSENLNHVAAKHYMNISLRRGFASDHGTELGDILPPMSPLNPKYVTKKKHVFGKISKFVEKFEGVGEIGEIGEIEEVIEIQ